MPSSTGLMRFALSVLPVLSLLFCSASFAASKMMVSSANYKHLQKVEALINQNQLEEAQLRCTKLLRKKTLNPYEKSVTQQILAGIYIRKENYPLAIHSFQAVISLAALPENNLLNIHYTLAQLYMQNEDYDNARKNLKIWLDKTEHPESDAWQFLASIYIAQEQYPEAIPAAKKALSLAQVKKPSHYQLLLSLYQRTNKNQLAISLLEETITHFPEHKEYWMQLFYMLNKAGREKQALETLDLAYVNKLLTDNDELVQLAQLHLYHENPLRAALILEAGMDAGKIKLTELQLQLLSSAWFNAREYEKLLNILKQSAKLSGKGETYFQLAKTYRGLGRWQDAIDALKMALADKNVQNTGAYYLLMGLAYSELENYADAEKAFENSLSDERTRDEAQKWIDYIAPSTEPIL